MSKNKDINKHLKKLKEALLSKFDEVTDVRYSIRIGGNEIVLYIVMNEDGYDDYDLRNEVRVFTYETSSYRFINTKYFTDVKIFKEDEKALEYESTEKIGENNKEDEKDTIILDFDGVIHSYKSGWKGVENIPDEPVEGVDEAIKELRKHFKVVVHSSRCHQDGGIEAIKSYLDKHNIEVDEVVRNKVPAVAQVDDRAITFNGVWSDKLIERIKNFKAWHEE